MLSQAEIAKWISGASSTPITQGSVSRWLAARENVTPLVVVPQPVEVEKIEKAEPVVKRTAKRSGPSPTPDGLYFLNELKEIVGELRAIIVDETCHPQLRASAAGLAVQAALEGQGLANEYFEITEVRTS